MLKWIKTISLCLYFSRRRKATRRGPRLSFENSTCELCMKILSEQLSCIKCLLNISHHSLCYSATGSWIGLQDLIEEGHFLWTTTQREAAYTNWAPGEPDDLSGEDCVWITNDPSYRAGSWNDDKCETFQTHVICEQLVLIFLTTFLYTLSKQYC